MELWDAYTREGELTDVVLVRGERIPDGFYHMVCEVLVRHADGSFLLMQRDHAKPSYPGQWEATAGGSALRGEDKMTCIKRELREETGLDGHIFAYLGCEVDEPGHSLFESFLCIVDCDKSAVTLQEGETVAYRWVNAEEMAAYIASDNNVDHQIRRYSAWYRKNGLMK